MKLSRIILIETSTSVCSVALAEGSCAADARIIASRITSEPRAHASKTAVFVKEVLDECGLSVSDCAAVCVSSGPGSYTGLRVGSSTAKGLCFGAGIPLIAVGTLELLAWQAIAQAPTCDLTIIPMIDARRMEVYSAEYTAKAPADDTAFACEPVQLTEVSPLVLDETSYAEEIAAGNVCFIGDGAEKFEKMLLEKGLLQSSSPDSFYGNNTRFIKANPIADSMLIPAFKALESCIFQDTAYFEPFYLKDFVATVSKKSLF